MELHWAHSITGRLGTAPYGAPYGAPYCAPDGACGICSTCFYNIGWFNTKLPHLVVLKELSHTLPTLEMISFLPFKMLQVLLAGLMPINDIQQE